MTNISETLSKQVGYAKLILVPIGVIALLYWATQERSVQLLAFSPHLVLGALVALISLVPFSMRLRQVMRVINFRISPLDTVRIITQSMFYYFFVPLSVGTEISKFAKLRATSTQHSPGAIAAGIVLDHLVGLATLIVLSISLYWSLRPITVKIDPTIVAALGSVAVLGLILVAGRRRLTAKFDLDAIKNNLGAHKLDLLIAALNSLLMHLLIAAAVTLGAMHWQIDITYLNILFVLTGAFLFQMIPLNFVGISALEVAGTGLYLAVGLELSEALILVSLLYCYRILIAVLGGAWEFIAATSAERKKSADNLAS